MNKHKYLALGLVAGAMALTACDEVTDCGCDCNPVRIDSFALLNPNGTLSEEEIAEKKVTSGTTVVIYGQNLSDVTAVKYGSRNVTLYPALMSDSRIVYKVPDGIVTDEVAHFITKSCKEGFIGEPAVYLAAPCVTACDNEFALHKIKVKGNSLVDGIEAYFWSETEQDYTLKSPNVDLKDNNNATIDIPAGYGPNHPIKFVTSAGESFSQFIFHDETNLLYTGDDEAYLNKMNALKPTGDAGKSEFTSTENNGEFAVFDWSDFQALGYYPCSWTSNTTKTCPKYPTTMGPYAAEIAAGQRSLSDMCVRFEIAVPEAWAMQGNGFCLSFGGAMEGLDLIGECRKYCAYFQPCEVTFNKPDEGNWTISNMAKWHTGGEWITISVPMSEFNLNLGAASYQTSFENKRLIPDGDLYQFFGAGNSDAPYCQTYPADDAFTYDLGGDITPLADGDFDNAYGSLILCLVSYDNPGYACEVKSYFAIDNLRVVPDDGFNGEVYKALDWGVATRDFKTKAILNCK